MFGYLAKKIFGSANERIIKSALVVVGKINALESSMQILSDTALMNKTVEFRARIEQGESLDHILPEAFAVVREAAKRTLGMRHFDVQLVGGILLHQGKITEMKMGEGKTLVATAPVYLNALNGKGVHVVTVNDYLAHRDSEWMGKVYNALGLTVSCITNALNDEARRQAYLTDITYGTNNEFGFDYLRDNLKYEADDLVQRQFHYAIVDEVDSILIDEARTPLIISGALSDQSKLYVQIDQVVQKLDVADIEIDEKSKAASLTEPGHHNIEEILKKYAIIKEGFGLYDLENMTIVHHLNQALKARHIFKKDVDYIVKDDRVMIIDEFTGRIMEGRRYSEGLHQAIEAKEKVQIQSENHTLASITFQNYFRMYPKLAGMTGTAMTEANEFIDIYRLEVVAIPTHLKIARKDEEDEIYKTAAEKYEAIVDEIIAAHEKDQPVLVGTVSIEKSEHISKMLQKLKIKHNVLNARYHEQEAQIIALAGQSGAITIATNMAGRGTDIMLGGNTDMMHKISANLNLEEIEKAVLLDKENVLKNGGLLVIGTERHESRRIDNQLRGRSGRQGDPGRTKFYLSLEDDLMRLFGSEKIGSMLTKLGLKKGEAIVHPWISKSLEKAQQRVELRNYEIRKNLLKFDDVVNEQRKVIYAQRLEIMTNQDLYSMLKDVISGTTEAIVSQYIPEKSYKEMWDLAGLIKEIHRVYGLDLALQELAAKDGNAEVEIIQCINNNALNYLEEQAGNHGAQAFNMALANMFLHSVDQLWRDHLHSLDNLRGGISLRAYAQKDPLNEYKIESFKMFKSMLEELDLLIVSRCMRVQISHGVHNHEQEERLKHLQTNKGVDTEFDLNNPATWGKVARNEPCPCGSGKKYKHCHGAL